LSGKVRENELCKVVGTLDAERASGVLTSHSTRNVSFQRLLLLNLWSAVSRAKHESEC